MFALSIEPLPEFVKDFVDGLLGPVSYFVIAVVVFWAMIQFRRLWTKGWFIGSLTVVGSLFYLWSLTDEDFRLIVSKPDNVPITILFFALGGVLWIAFRRMVINDELIAKGLPTFEARESRKRVMCWPDLLYSEFLALIVCSILLLVWAYYLKAPLEQPAHPTATPNPAKAPWYFLGLQEMLVYFDPWLAGVVFPTFIIVGLMAIPFVDVNPKGCGYYTFKERPFAITTFLFGFIVLWILLIVLGTFLRGPNWDFFGPYSFWDVHKVQALNNINLSDIFYIDGLERPLPSNIWLRELPGLVVVILYFVAVPPILANLFFRKLYVRMGFIRYQTMAFFVICMAALPLKMILRWTINLKYVVALPEWSFNI